MTVNLYNNSSASNTLYKSLSSVASGISAQFKGSVDVERPALILDWQGVSFNYIEITDWGRYYYVTSITALPGDMTEIIGLTDPLQTAAAQIASRPALAVRNEDKSKWDKNEPDPLMITKSKRIYKGHAFGSMQNITSNSDATYVLGVI